MYRLFNETVRQQCDNPELTAVYGVYSFHKPFNTRKLNMQNENPNAERYIAIARACLKAINDTARDSGDREQKIQAVYEAIDSAFQAEFADYRQSVAIMATVLERIASGELDGQKAAELARKTIDQQPQASRNSAVH